MMTVRLIWLENLIISGHLQIYLILKILKNKLVNLNLICIYIVMCTFTYQLESH